VAIKVKGGMYCKRCDKPVMAQKTGHGVRNTLAVGGTLATAGLSLLGAKSEKWRCPTCGGPCIPESQVRTNAAISRMLSSREQRKKAVPSPASGKVAWRCEKNGHRLDRKRTTCPIDGSRAVWK
jgi:rubrerythrin